MMMKHSVLSFCRRHRPSSSPLIRVLRRRRLVTVSSGSRFCRCFDKRTSHSFFVSSRVGFFSICFPPLLIMVRGNAIMTRVRASGT